MPGRAKFRNHDFQISQNFSFWQVFENYNIIWCFYFWRVLLVITAPSPPLPPLRIFNFFPPYTLIPPLISGKLTWPQKIIEVSSDSPPPHCSWGRREVDAMIMPDIYFFAQVTLKYWVGVQRGQSYLMGRRCLFNLGWPPF